MSVLRTPPVRVDAEGVVEFPLPGFRLRGRTQRQRPPTTATSGGSNDVQACTIHSAGPPHRGRRCGGSEKQAGETLGLPNRPSPRPPKPSPAGRCRDFSGAVAPNYYPA